MGSALKEYEVRIDEICGTMVRLCLSLPGQRRVLQKLVTDHGLPPESTLTTVTFGNTPAPPVHTATFAEQLRSLEDEGHDEAMVGNVCTSFIYSLWEDKYRGEFAKQRGVGKNVIGSELFRELGTYRHAVIHNQAIGTSKTAVLTLLPAVAQGDAVRVTRHTFELIVAKIKSELQAVEVKRWI